MEKVEPAWKIGRSRSPVHKGNQLTPTISSTTFVDKIKKKQSHKSGGKIRNSVGFSIISQPTQAKVTGSDMNE